jgi:protein phosphatase
MNQISCPNCQAINREEANYCARCGQRLNGARNEIDETPTQPYSAPPLESFDSDAMQTTPTRPSLALHVGQRTDTGRVRQSNEDSLLVLDLTWNNISIGRPAGLFVVADGMGGHEGGEIASGLLVKAIAQLAIGEWLPRLVEDGAEPNDHGEWLSGAIQSGNERIYEWSRQAGVEMGTTVVAALIIGNRGHIAHVGDSRAYRINDQGMERLTVDHSLVESLVVANRLSPEKAREHPQVNVIYRTIGDQRQVAVDINPVHLVQGDTLLLCSDGLTGMLTDKTIFQLVIGATHPQAACDALVEAANQAGGDDNVTVVVITLQSLSAAGGAPPA